MGKNLTGIAVGPYGVTMTAAEVSRGSVKLLGSWRDCRALDLASPSVMTERVADLLASSGIRRGPVAVSLPDTMARVTIADFQELRAGKKDAGLLVRAGAMRGLGIGGAGWRLSSQLFDMASGKRALSAAVRDEALGPVEEAISAAGMKLRSAGLHSLSIANILPQGDEDGGLIVRFHGFVTVMFFKSGVPDFYRCKPVEGSGAEAGREVAASFAFYNGMNPERRVGRVYIADETGCLPESLPDAIKADLAAAGQVITGSMEPAPGVLAALGASLSDA